MFFLLTFFFLRPFFVVVSKLRVILSSIALKWVIHFANKNRYCITELFKMSLYLIAK